MTAAAASVHVINQPHEIAEKIKRIVRTRCRLGMILHGDRRLAAMPEALERLIVQVDVRVLDVVFAERIRIDGEAMILRSDLHAPTLQMLDWMIAAAVSELQL